MEVFGTTASRRTLALAIAMFCFVLPECQATLPVLPSRLTLPAHPRLILTPKRIASLQADIASDADALSFYNGTLEQAEYLLGVPPGPHPRPNATGDARYALQRIYSLSMMWALTHNASWASRATSEALVVAAWPCFDVPCGQAQLNTGEALHALAMALDWLYDYLNTTERAAIVSAMVTKGLGSVAQAYIQPPPSWASAFVNTTSNWNMVVNGGTILGCLAVADEPGVPSWVSDSLLPSALSTIQQSIDGFWPDGGWQEGPNYAGCEGVCVTSRASPQSTCESVEHLFSLADGTRYFVPVAFSLITALGPAYSLLDAPGVSGAAFFALSHLTPREEDWAWDDAPAIPETRSQHLALAGYFGQAGVAAAFRRWVQAVYIPPDSSDVVAMNYPVALLYFTPLGGDADIDALQRYAHFKAQHTFSIRSNWTDPGAAFIGWQGSNISWAWAHGNLHGGAFVYQSHGQWWAQDLGHDNYALPQYFWVNRFNLYRTNTLGHNTLTFDSLSQSCKVTGKYSSDCPAVPMTVLNVSTASAPLAQALDAFAVINASAAWAYAGLGSVQRGFASSQNASQLVILDEVGLSLSATPTSAPTTLQWRLHTVANVSIAPDGLSALLSSPNTTAVVAVHVLVPSTTCPGLAFSALPVILEPPQLPCPECTLLQLTAPLRSCVRLAVVISPGDGLPSIAQLRPLSQWQEFGPFE